MSVETEDPVVSIESEPASVIADSTGGAELGFAYHTNTSGGWEIEIGVQATGNFQTPRGASPVSGGSFSVTISR